MGADVLGESLTKSMARMVYSRPHVDGLRTGPPAEDSELPDDSAVESTSAPAASSSAPPPPPPPRPTAGAAATTATASDAAPGVTHVSAATHAFNSRHAWFDGNGNRIAPDATRTDVERTQKPPEKIPPKPIEQRRADRIAASKEMWKKINPGYMPNPERSHYDHAFHYDPTHLAVAKGAPLSWKHHLLKTDTAAFVEAVARERVFATAMKEDEKSAEAAAKKKPAGGGEKKEKPPPKAEASPPKAEAAEA
jgi:hypothetical protein